MNLKDLFPNLTDFFTGDLPDFVALPRKILQIKWHDMQEGVADLSHRFSSEC